MELLDLIRRLREDEEALREPTVPIPVGVHVPDGAAVKMETADGPVLFVNPAAVRVATIAGKIQISTERTPAGGVVVRSEIVEKKR